MMHAMRTLRAARAERVGAERDAVAALAERYIDVRARNRQALVRSLANAIQHAIDEWLREHDA